MLKANIASESTLRSTVSEIERESEREDVNITEAIGHHTIVDAMISGGRAQEFLEQVFAARARSGRGADQIGGRMQPRGAEESNR